MGLIRATLHLASGGAVAARSRKQRTQAQILAATQGKSDAEVAAAGGRSFEWYERAKVEQRAARQRARKARKVAKPTFTPEELEYMAKHVPPEHGR